MTIRYCKLCVTPDTRPNGKFNRDGICIPCEHAKMAREENYERRLSELRQLIKRILSGRRHPRWSCIVGVSGGKDSTRQALWVREKLQMNPLLVSVAYPPRQISNIGVDNISNLIRHGFDTMIIGPAPRLSRQLVRHAFLRFCNWCKATEMALCAGVPRIAFEKKIPVIFWGENPALYIGDMNMLGDSIWDGNNMVNSNTLGGGALGWFEEVAGGSKKLQMYAFPTRAELKKQKVSSLFLGPAWRDWYPEVNSRVSLVNNLKFRGGDPHDTGDLVGTNMVDEDWTIVNFLLKYYKLGFSRITDHATFLIRSGEITREEAIKLVEEYDGACSDQYIESFCRYIDITVDEFWATVRKFANPEMFDVGKGQRPVKKFTVGTDLP